MTQSCRRCGDRSTCRGACASGNPAVLGHPLLDEEGRAPRVEADRQDDDRPRGPGYQQGSRGHRHVEDPFHGRLRSGPACRPQPDRDMAPTFTSASCVAFRCSVDRRSTQLSVSKSSAVGTTANPMTRPVMTAPVGARRTECRPSQPASRRVRATPIAQRARHRRRAVLSDLLAGETTRSFAAGPR
jgi:hypothetical protein